MSGSTVMADPAPSATRSCPVPPAESAGSASFSDLYRDASTVYAEGVWRGLAMAVGFVGRFDVGRVPPELLKVCRDWQAIAIHREWLAGEGRPVQFLAIPVTDEERLLLSVRQCPACGVVSSCG